MRIRLIVGIQSLFVLLLCTGVRGNDLFSVTARTTSGTSQSVTASSGNVSDLVSDLVTNSNQFSGLQNRDVSASLKYAGINNAIDITRNAADNSATVRIPSTGLTKTFSAGSSDALKDQILDYVKQSGATEYGRFLRVVNHESMTGVTDGNPLATTALLADDQYNTFGMNATPYFFDGADHRLDEVVTPRLRWDEGGGVANTRDGNSYFIRGSFDMAFRFGDRVGLVLSSPFMYRNLESTNTYEAGEILALPIAILPNRGNKALQWTVTPAGAVGAGGSLELAAGGTFAGGGITSVVTYPINGWTFSVANHYSFYHGYPIDIGKYSFDTDLEQQILKNGARIGHTLGKFGSIDLGLTYTSFLERAAVSEYWTPAVGADFRLGRNVGLRVAYNPILARGFTAHEGDVTLYINY